ncbi:MFS transporter [Janibacter limosus]|uniref:MFS transporter n=1 Tax=Janibacter limosus TaxID=53458 RepID=UPI0009FEED6B|nr:MFS transporter [Janibacter limosus]
MSLVPGLPPTGRAAVRAGVVGNYVDQINIFLPVVALAPALVTLAGPHAGVTAGAIVIVATLLGRPIGSMVFGRISDRIGRTRTTKVAIAGTAVCSLAIAAVPTHESIGAAAIATIVLLRFVGGIFLAGEYTSAIPLAMEWSAPRRRGMVSGLIMSMAPWAQSSIAFATAGLVALLGPHAYAEWGWRLAFVAGGLASLALLRYYSTRVGDAPQVVRRTETTGEGSAPATLGLRAVLRGVYAPAFWQMFGLMSGLWLMTNMVVILATGRLSADHDLAGSEVAVIMGVAAIAQAVVMSGTGHWSSLLGRRRFFIGWGVAAALLAPALWFATMTAGVLPFVVGIALLQVITVCGYGPVGAYLCERFPAHVRATGYGTAYSLSIVGPALWPWWLPALEPVLGHDGSVVVVLALGGLLVAGCGALGPRLDPTDLDRDVESVSRQLPDPVASR